MTTPIITSEMLNPILKGSFVSPSLLAYIVNRKYFEAVPLYRKEQQFKNFKIDLLRQNLANWIIHGANNWFKYLYDSSSFEPQISLYEYQPSRASKHPKTFLKGFLQTDEYSGYNDIIQVSCFTHARRSKDF